MTSHRCARTLLLLACCHVIALSACSGDRRTSTHEAGVATGDGGASSLDDASVDAAEGGAPALDRTVTSSFAAGFGFLHEGPDAVQTGVAPGAIDPARMAVVRGRVLDLAAQPLAGVLVSAPHEPKLGSTKTKADGTFDFVINGGGAVALAFAGEGFLPLQRKVKPPHNTFERAADVFLTKRDAKVSEVALGAGQLQTASGSSVSDRSGQRTGTLMFGAGTTAELVLPNGTKQPLAMAHVRVTEYTAGDTGPSAMPAELPPQSGYTYAVELSVDEAEAAGATEVRFSKPVPYYVENFLNFPVGEPVPAGFLDRQSGNWVAAASGRVIKILTVQVGSAQIDADGDGQPDSAEALGMLGVDAEELSALAAKYAAGTSLWRIPLSHFSAWDFNWCFFGKLFDALADLFDGRPLPDSCTASGSVIECENQILGESVGLVGLPYGLHYRSDRVPGRRDAFHFEVQLTGAEPPPDAKRVRFELDILGQHITHVAEAKANQRYEFDWDGKDAYGRVWQGPATVRYRVGYVYDGWYSHTPVFGAYGERDSMRWQRAPDNQVARPAGITAEDDLARLETTMWLPWQASVLGTFDASALGFGGLTLGIHHAYDSASRTLYLGTGDRRQATDNMRAVRALLGADEGKGDTSGQARRTQIDAPHGLAVAADGTVYVSLEGKHQVLRVLKDGKTELVAGTGMPGLSGDGGPALLATLNKPLGLALGADGTLYIAERENKVVRRVRPDGVIETIAGGGVAPDDGAAKLPRSAVLGEPHALAVGLDGSLFIVDASRHNVRRLRTDGLIETVLGSPTGVAGDEGDGGPGSKALLRNPLSAAVGSDGSLYIAEFEGHRIRRLTPDGTVSSVAGTGTAGYGGDGGPATLATLNEPHTVDVGADGTLYITDEGNDVLRSVTPDGIIRTIAGGGATRAVDFTPALDAEFKQPRLTVIEPDGNLLVADYEGDFIYRVSPFLPAASAGGSTIASEDGSVYYSFDSAGRHLSTVSVDTQKPTWTFIYDAQGRLSGVQDLVGRMMAIERDAGGRAVKLTSPDGLASGLGYDDRGWLSSVQNPAGEQDRWQLSEAGLLLSETDPAGRVHSFSYDASGRLLKDTEPSGSYQTLERSADKRVVTRKNALGHTTVYAREKVDGEDKLTVTAPDGLKSVRTKRRTTTVTTAPDGTKQTTVLRADPRFGMQAPYAGATTVALPSGLTTKVTHSRALTYLRADDPSAVSTQTDTITLSGAGEVQTVYDATTRTLTRRARGDTSASTFDELGRVVQVQPGGGLAPMTLRYDGAGRLAEVAQGTRKSTYSYDARGFLVDATDAAGRAQHFEYDAVGRTTSASLTQQPLASFMYAAGGDLAALSTPTMSAHKFGYDVGGRVSSYEPPIVPGAPSSKVDYAYDLDDALKSVTYPSGSKVESQRDAAGRLTNLVMPQGSVVYQYDPTTGAVASVALGEEKLALGWDGPLPVSAVTTGTVSAAVRVKYDSALRPIEESVSSGSVNTAATYGYDASGRLVTVASETLVYRDAQRISARNHGVVSESYSYSADYGELSGQDAKVNGGSAYSVAYTRDALGRIASQQETIEGVASTTTYGYDVLGRLLSAADASGSHTYSYDANGNRLDGDAAYDAQDRLARRAGVTYEYTVDGDLSRRTDASGTREYVYDVRGQLRKVALPGGKTITYVIDALGRRVAKQVDGQLTQAFVYDLAGRVRGELDATGTMTSRFIYGARQHVPDYVAREGVKLQLLTDARGSVRLVVDVASGQVVQRLDYDAWGNVLRDTSPGLQPFGFAGGLWDADTRLVRFGARDYDAETGRWTAKDPIGFSGGQANLYAYVGNDPINAIDPSGLVVETLWDAYSLAAGITSLLENLGCGNYGEAGVDAVGVAFDAFAAAIPVLPGGVGALRQAARGAENVTGEVGKASLSATKKALKAVHKEVGGPLPPGNPGKFGSPQRGTPKKGYRLDPGHPGRPSGDPEAGPHINWWDYTDGKRGAGGRSGAIPIE